MPRMRRKRRGACDIGAHTNLSKIRASASHSAKASWLNQMAVLSEQLQSDRLSPRHLSTSTVTRGRGASASTLCTQSGKERDWVDDCMIERWSTRDSSGQEQWPWIPRCRQQVSLQCTGNGGT